MYILFYGKYLQKWPNCQSDMLITKQYNPEAYGVCMYVQPDFTVRYTSMVHHITDL